jgi:hypothetical protein
MVINVEIDRLFTVCVVCRNQVGSTLGDVDLYNTSGLLTNIEIVACTAG